MTAWNVDPVHSGVDFSVKHMMVTTVRGDLAGVEGVIDFDEAESAHSAVEVRIPTASVNTTAASRDAHLRSADARQFPFMTFKSTGIDPDGDAYRIRGDLTIRDVTRPVVLDHDRRHRPRAAGSPLGRLRSAHDDPTRRLGPDLEQGPRDRRLGRRRRDQIVLDLEASEARRVREGSRRGRGGCATPQSVASL